MAEMWEGTKGEVRACVCVCVCVCMWRDMNIYGHLCVYVLANPAITKEAQDTTKHWVDSQSDLIYFPYDHLQSQW
jgi:hypothetical protein